MAEYLRFELLGRFRLVRQEGPLDLSPGLPTLLLAILLLNPGRLFARDELAEMIWPDEDPQVTRTRLRQLLLNVRKLIGNKENGSSVFDVSRTTIQLAANCVETDVRDFRHALAKSCGLENGLSSAEWLERAVALYQGDLLPGFYHDLVLSERDRLAAEHRSALHALAHEYEQDRRYTLALDTARQALTTDPLSEESHLALIRIHAAMGQPAAARRQYQELERITRQELGAEPSQAAKELVGQLDKARAAADVRMPEPGDDGAQTIATGNRASWLERVNRLRWAIVATALAVISAAIALSMWIHPSRDSRPSSRRPDSADGSSVDAADVMWATPYRPVRGEEDSEAVALTSDADGGVSGSRLYLTGLIRTEKTDVDFITQAFDASGRLLWDRRYDGPAHDVDRAAAICVDRDGNVYVAGASLRGDGNGKTRLAGLDIAVVKYDRNGERSRTWPTNSADEGVGVRRYNGETDGQDYARAIAVDAAGGVYVLGKSWSIEGHDIVLIKWNSHGEREWVKRFGDPRLDDEPRGIALCPNGDVAICGNLSGDLTERDGNRIRPNAFVARLSRSGEVLWKRVTGEHNDCDDTADCITVASDESVVVSGFGGSPNAERPRPGLAADYMLLKYDKGGHLRWELHGPAIYGVDNHPRSIAVNQHNEVFVTGETSRIGSDGKLSFSVFTICYRPDGTVKWSDQLMNYRKNCFLFALAVRPFGVGAYVVGSGAGLQTPTGNGIFALNYDETGERMSLSYFGTKSTESGSACGMTVGTSLMPVVAGTASEGGYKSLLLVKFGAPLANKQYPLRPPMRAVPVFPLAR